MKHLKQHNVLTYQGLCKGSQILWVTVDSLITVNDLAESIDDSSKIDAILLDVLKAFESHSRPGAYAEGGGLGGLTPIGQVKKLWPNNFRSLSSGKW